MRVNAKCAAIFALSLIACVAGCGVESDPEGHVDGADVTAIPARSATVLADTCVLDTFQQAALNSASMKKVVSEVVLLCLVPQYDGGLAPSDPSGTASVLGYIQMIQAAGYRAKLGVSFSDESGERSDATQTTALLHDPAWQAKVVSNIVAAAEGADGVDIDFEKLQSSARNDVTTFVQTLAGAVHAKGKTIALYVPPSIKTPSDLPGGDAYDLAAFDKVVDKVRVTTLDYSDTPGPTIDPGWAVDAMNNARQFFTTTPLDISYPLYGADFGPLGIRGTSWLEARGLADNAGIGAFPRGPTGAPFFDYSAVDGDHEIWFDDSESTVQALAAWGYDTVPQSSGIFFWGLGSEDPALWDELARRLP